MTGVNKGDSLSETSPGSGYVSLCIFIATIQSSLQCGGNSSSLLVLLGTHPWTHYKMLDFSAGFGRTRALAGPTICGSDLGQLVAYRFKQLVLPLSPVVSPVLIVG